MMLNIEQALSRATSELAHFDNRRHEAEYLLAFVLHKERSYLRAFAETYLSDEEEVRFNSLLQRRTAGEPLAYIVGHKEFWSLEFLVTPEVLIPRPHTELLVETALDLLSLNKSHRVLDLGTGSGAVACALASERPDWKITATDKSEAALNIAQQNAQRLNLANVSFVESDWCQNLSQETFDAIICNPPYIDIADPHLLDLQYEPKSALVAEDNGLADIEQIARQAQNYLSEGGYLLFEHGYQQATSVQSLLQDCAYENIRTLSDLQGLQRVTLAQILREDSE